MTSQPSPPKEKRGIASERRQRQLLLLVPELQRLQRDFPTVREDIQDAIDEIVWRAGRTRAADRQDVLKVLEDWRGVPLTIQELMEDTGLSDRMIRSILEKLLATDPPLIGSHEKEQGGEHGRRAKVYYLLLLSK